MNLKAPREGCGPSSPKAKCANNLKQMGLVFKMYSNESDGEHYPMLSSKAGKLTFNYDEVYPKYLSDLTVLNCSSKIEVSNNGQIFNSNTEYLSYWYLGSFVWDKLSGENFIKNYKKRLDEFGSTNFVDLLNANPTSYDSLILKPDMIFRLRDIRDYCWGVPQTPQPRAWGIAQSQIPVLIERPGHHKGGAHVLYMDGHVELVPYPGKFPMTVEFIAALEELESMDTQSLSSKGEV